MVVAVVAFIENFCVNNKQQILDETFHRLFTTLYWFSALKFIDANKIVLISRRRNESKVKTTKHHVDAQRISNEKKKK